MVEVATVAMGAMGAVTRAVAAAMEESTVMEATAARPTAALITAAVVTPWLRQTVRLARAQELGTAVTVIVKSRQVRWVHEMFGCG